MLKLWGHTLYSCAIACRKDTVVLPWRSLRFWSVAATSALYLGGKSSQDHRNITKYHVQIRIIVVNTVHWPVQTFTVTRCEGEAVSPSSNGQATHTQRCYAYCSLLNMRSASNAEPYTFKCHLTSWGTCWPFGASLAIPMKYLLSPFPVQDRPPLWYPGLISAVATQKPETRQPEMLVGKS